MPTRAIASACMHEACVWRGHRCVSSALSAAAPGPHPRPLLRARLDRPGREMHPACPLRRQHDVTAISAVCQREISVTSAGPRTPARLAPALEKAARALN
jgi:hypothetical protein